MGEASTPDNPYLFGHSEEETQRLQKQSRLFNPATRRMIAEAGVTAGMTVLDVGSGAGDVALLLAEAVGPTGTVIGVDRNPQILEVARARARAAGHDNVTFLAGDIGAVALDRQFDAVVGRCVLFFLPDPVAVLRQLVGQLRPGGVVAFQEPGNAAHPPAALPPAPLLDAMWSWIMALYRRVGMDEDAGLRLFRRFKEVGLPDPQMHLDAAVGGGADWAGYDYMASLVRTLLPLFIEHGIATAEEVGIETFADRLREQVVEQGGVMTTWSFVTAWARKP
jgi:ubiquinone/menaquinone biosynthesis C-methylase UbiE